MKPRKIVVQGDIAYVPLTKGYTAIIDAADAPLVEKHNWAAIIARNTVYAQRNGKKGEHLKSVLLHRAIMRAPADRQVDHVNGRGLDNRRANLRLATNAENARNRTRQSNNASGYKGVRKSNSRWSAEIRCDGVCKYLGIFDTPELAHAAYCDAAARLHGKFARAA